jgi:hypothetical protein
LLEEYVGHNFRVEQVKQETTTKEAASSSVLTHSAPPQSSSLPLEYIVLYQEVERFNCCYVDYVYLRTPSISAVSSVELL